MDAAERKQLLELQQKLQAALSDRSQADAELAVLRNILGGKAPLSVSVTDLLNYARQAQLMQARLSDMIAHLRAAQTLDEARAIGNSLDALFRATPVPQILASR